MSVPPFSKMTLKSFRSLISVVTADLAGVADVQAMQLVKPIWDGLCTTENKTLIIQSNKI